MQNLLRLLLQFRLFILFIALESIALVWMFSSRSFQRSAYLNSSNYVTGSVLENYDGFTDYLALKEQNKKLAKENARLRKALPELLLKPDSTFATVTDSAYKVRYTYQEAQVINSSYLKSRNFITINKGTLSGVQEEMGVIGPKGAIGEVKSVSENFATVIPIINQSLTISGALKGTGFFGPVKWRGDSYQYAEVNDIPRFSKVKPGDSVVTDARSLIFPPGILIGTVEDVNLQSDQNFYALRIKLATDFSSINEVYVVLDKNKTEILQLQNN